MMSTGEQLRIEGIQANLAAATSPTRDFAWHAARVMARFMREHREFSAEDIRREIPAGVEPHHPNVLGSVIGAARSRGEIVPVGRCLTTRPSRHASRNTVWTAAPAEGAAA